MNEEPNKATATLTLTSLPTERRKAVIRLMQATMLHSAAVLRHQVQGISALADVDELSFRRHSGAVDISAAFNTSGQLGTASDDLMAAALAFAEADRSEILEEHQQRVRNIGIRVGGGDPRVGEAMVLFIEEVRNVESVHVITAEPIATEGVVRVTTFAHPPDNAREATYTAELKVMAAFPELRFDFNLRETSMGDDGQAVLPNDSVFVVWSA